MGRGRGARGDSAGNDERAQEKRDGIEKRREWKRTGKGRDGKGTGLTRDGIEIRQNWNGKDEDQHNYSGVQRRKFHRGHDRVYMGAGVPRRAGDGISGHRRSGRRRHRGEGGELAGEAGAEKHKFQDHQRTGRRDL